MMHTRKTESPICEPRKAYQREICPCPWGKIAAISIKSRIIKHCLLCKAYFIFVTTLGSHLGIFFDEKNANPAQLSALIEDLKRLDETSLQHIAAIVKEMIRTK